jgi:hypothetical protein
MRMTGPLSSRAIDMKPTSALWPLVRRPASILPLLYLLFALSFPYLMVKGYLGLSLGSRSEALSDAREMLWINSILSVGGMAALLSLFARAADMKLFAFAVPSLRFRVLTEKFVFGLLLAVVLSLSLTLTGDSGNAPAIFGCAALFFAIVSAMADPSVPMRLKEVVSLGLFAALYKYALVRAAFESAPILTSLISLIFAGVLIRRELSVETSRARALYQPRLANNGTGTAFPARAADTGMRVEQLSTSGTSLFDWFRRTEFENFGARRLGWIGYLIPTVGVSCVFSSLLGDPSFATIMGLMYLSFQGHKLRGSSLYPLSRTTRADLNFVGSAADSAAYFLSATVAVWLLAKAGIPQLFSDGGDIHKGNPIDILPAAMIWAPLVQWLSSTTTLPLAERLKFARHGLPTLIVSLIAFVLTLFTARGGTRLAAATSPGIAIGLAVLVGLMVQVGYWVALRRRFRKKDLV